MGERVALDKRGNDDATKGDDQKAANGVQRGLPVLLPHRQEHSMQKLGNGELGYPETVAER